MRALLGHTLRFQVFYQCSAYEHIQVKHLLAYHCYFNEMFKLKAGRNTMIILRDISLSPTERERERDLTGSDWLSGGEV